jgi:acetyl-CoA acetyltransferase
MGNDRITGPLISQACATSAACIFTAASRIETDMYKCILATSSDRCSNSPHSISERSRRTGSCRGLDDGQLHVPLRGR